MRVSRTVKTVRKVTVRNDNRSRTVEKSKAVRTVKTTRGGALSFGKGNAKLGKNVATFSLPAGYTCPGAADCLSRANRQTGKITDGPATLFRCFAATAEARHVNVRESRWDNLEALRACTSADEMAELILSSLPRNVDTVRIHVSGDFFSGMYFDAWLLVASRRPDLLFYAYTKSLPLWAERIDRIPSNCVLTASAGGKHDHLILEHGLRQAIVVYSEAEAAQRGLEIDHDDSHAMRADGRDFALLIHGSQPAGSEAARAISALRAQGEFGYGERADEIRASRRFALATV
jgi:hypothetical protein